MKAAFMGTAPFAVPCLQAMARAGHHIAAVVTQPDRPRGRGLKLQESPVKIAATELALPVLQPEKASQQEFVAALRQIAPEVIVVVAYGQILRPAVLEIPQCGCINVHGSLLPELRGAAPIQWAIIRGYRETGVTTMFMDPGMDTGDIILQAPLPVREDDTAGSLADRMAPLGADLLLRTLAVLAFGRAPRRPQENERATYAPLLCKEDGAVDWGLPAAEIVNRVRGCNPSPGAYACRGEQTVRLWRAAVDDAAGGSHPPGTVVSSAPLVIAAGGAAVRLDEVQPENRARMSGAEFARGYRVAAGEVWRGGLQEWAVGVGRLPSPPPN